MSQAVGLSFALAVPFLCLGLLLWLARLEETLTDGIDPERRPREAKSGTGSRHSDAARRAA